MLMCLEDGGESLAQNAVTVTQDKSHLPFSSPGGAASGSHWLTRLPEPALAALKSSLALNGLAAHGGQAKPAPSGEKAKARAVVFHRRQHPVVLCPIPTLASKPKALPAAMTQAPARTLAGCRSLLTITAFLGIGLGHGHVTLTCG